MLFPVLVICWVVAGATWRRALSQAAIAAIAVTVVVTPWLVRNTVVMHSTVFSTGIGDALCDSRHPDTTGQYEIAAEYCLDPYEEIPSRAERWSGTARTPRPALKFVLHHPVDEARLWFWRGYFSYRDDHDPLEVITFDKGHLLHDSRLVGALESAADAYYFVVLGLALLALPAFLRRTLPYRAQRLCLLLAGVTAALVPFILFGDPRYKIPVYPFFAIGAAVSLSRLWTASFPRPRDAQD